MRRAILTHLGGADRAGDLRRSATACRIRRSSCRRRRWATGVCPDSRLPVVTDGKVDVRQGIRRARARKSAAPSIRAHAVRRSARRPRR